MDASKRELLIAIACLVVILGGIAVLASFAPRESQPVASNPDAPPPMTPLMQEVLANSNGFQYLVSYTDSGFEPATLAVQAGETVRFTNNSSQNLWVAASAEGGAIYPAGGKNCGQSAFDSCVAMQPLEFWEFTFDLSGEWSFANNINKSRSGVVRVE